MSTAVSCFADSAMAVNSAPRESVSEAVLERSPWTSVSSSATNHQKWRELFFVLMSFIRFFPFFLSAVVLSSFSRVAKKEFPAPSVVIFRTAASRLLTTKCTLSRAEFFYENLLTHTTDFFPRNFFERKENNRGAFFSSRNAHHSTQF